MFCINGNSNVLSCDFFPPIELGNARPWEIGLVNLCTYNSIPNIEVGVNNMFHYKSGKDGSMKVIELAEGSYEVDDIVNYIKERLEDNVELNIRANNNTLKCELKCSVEVDFTKMFSVGSVFGFASRLLEPKIWHTSVNPVNIIRVNTIRIECNLTRGSYNNGREGHTIHEFFPAVAPGFKLVESPSTIIYVPVNAQRITNITVRIVDQEGRLINFRGENITVRLHLRQQLDHGFSVQ